METPQGANVRVQFLTVISLFPLLLPGCGLHKVTYPLVRVECVQYPPLGKLLWTIV